VVSQVRVSCGTMKGKQTRRTRARTEKRAYLRDKHTRKMRCEDAIVVGQEEEDSNAHSESTGLRIVRVTRHILSSQLPLWGVEANVLVVWSSGRLEMIAPA
jgi:hypothetical protein